MKPKLARLRIKQVKVGCTVGAGAAAVDEHLDIRMAIAVGVDQGQEFRRVVATVPFYWEYFLDYRPGLAIDHPDRLAGARALFAEGEELHVESMIRGLRVLFNPYRLPSRFLIRRQCGHPRERQAHNKE